MTTAFTPQELLVLERAPKSSLSSVAEKIEEATLIKEQGNIYFKHGDFKKAIQKYNYIKLWISGLSIPGDKMSQYHQGNASMCATVSQGEQIQQLFITSYTNLAMARLKLEQYDAAVDACNQALSHDPNNIKALVRKAQAFSSMGKYSIAKEVLRKAFEIEPKNMTVRKALQVAIEQNKLFPEKDLFRDNLAKNVTKSGGL